MALNGKVTSRQLTENLEYYEDYINTETRKGKSEEEVLAALGDPRLIARTIVETGGGGSGQGTKYGESSEWYGGDADTEYQPQGPFERGHVSPLARVPLWAWLILALLIVVLILSAVFSVITALLPILLPILGVLFLVKVFRDWLN